VWAIGKATTIAQHATAMACWTIAGAECTATASPTMTLTPTLALTPRPTQPSTSAPSATPQPLLSTPVPLAQPAQAAGQGQVIQYVNNGIIDSRYLCVVNEVEKKAYRT